MIDEKGILDINEISEVGVTDGLVAYYPMNGNAKDYSGNALHATNYGATVVAGLGGLSYLFDGTDDYLLVANNSIFNPASITVSGWIKLLDGGNWMMVSKGAGAGGYYIYGDVNTYAIWTMFGPTGARHDVNFGGLAIGTWYYLTATFDVATGRQAAYKNGVLISEKLSAELGTINSTAVRIGQHTSSYYTYGNIQDVRIYNRALTPEEILIMYKLKVGGAGMQISESGKVYLSGQLKEV